MIQAENPSFDDFMNRIQNCDSLSDALKIQLLIYAEIQKKQSEISNCNNSDVVDGILVSDLRLYLVNLQTAYSKIEKRISNLGGQVKLDEKGQLIKLLKDSVFFAVFADFLDRVDKRHVIELYSLLESFKIYDTSSKEMNISCSVQEFQDLLSNYFSKSSKQVNISIDLKNSLQTAKSPNQINQVLSILQNEIIVLLDRDEIPNFSKTAAWKRYFENIEKEKIEDEYISDDSMKLKTKGRLINAMKKVTPKKLSVAKSRDSLGDLASPNPKNEPIDAGKKSDSDDGFLGMFKSRRERFGSSQSELTSPIKDDRKSSIESTKSLRKSILQWRKKDKQVEHEENLDSSLPEITVSQDHIISHDSLFPASLKTPNSITLINKSIADLQDEISQLEAKLNTLTGDKKRSFQLMLQGLFLELENRLFEKRQLEKEIIENLVNVY